MHIPRITLSATPDDIVGISVDDKDDIATFVVSPRVGTGALTVEIDVVQALDIRDQLLEAYPIDRAVPLYDCETLVLQNCDDWRNAGEIAKRIDFTPTEVLTRLIRLYKAGLVEHEAEEMKWRRV